MKLSPGVPGDLPGHGQPSRFDEGRSAAAGCKDPGALRTPGGGWLVGGCHAWLVGCGMGLGLGVGVGGMGVDDFGN